MTYTARAADRISPIHFSGADTRKGFKTRDLAAVSVLMSAFTSSDSLAASAIRAIWGNREVGYALNKVGLHWENVSEKA